MAKACENQNIKLDGVFEKIKQIFRIPSLKEYQEKTLCSFLAGNDCFVSQPTGSGKSLIFHALPFVKFLQDAEEQRKQTCESILRDCKNIVLVISPLIGLMKNQIEILKEKHIRAICLRHDEVDEIFKIEVKGLYIYYIQNY